MLRRGTYDAGVPTPLSVSHIYVESLRLWRGNFVRLTIMALFLEIPLVLAELGLHVGAGFSLSTERSAAVNAVALPVALYGSLSHHFLSGLLEKLVGSERHGHPNSTLREILRELPWWRLLGADLLMTLMVVVGYVAFVVPGLLIATWMTPLLVIVNLERRPVRASMRRSYRLVRGHFWRVFSVGFLALVVVQAVGELVGGLAASLSHAHVVEVIAHATPATLLMPIAALPIVVLTFDLVALTPRPAEGDAERDTASPSAPVGDGPGEPSQTPAGDETYTDATRGPVDPASGPETSP